MDRFPLLFLPTRESNGFPRLSLKFLKQLNDLLKE